MLNAFVVLAFVATCVADLRPASQPRNAWKTKQRNNKIQFQQKYSYYMEPSDFGYEGLKQQRANAYDNFLRSNIDNEQDRRNFDDEPGKDHLPFRNYEGMATDNHESIETQLPLGSAIVVKPGVPFLVPFRWNNPHAAEIEINLWLMHDPRNLIVVPIRKPACSGEGYQDNVFTFTIPDDYNQLKTKVPNFKGCDKVGDCVIQFYAHSVESRMYAHGVPVIVEEANWAAPDATDFSKVKEAKKDPALDLIGKQLDDEKGGQATMNVICIGSHERGSLDLKSAIPRKARLVSDVFNHAYQNSDFSPYAGQQPERISRNLQASVILKMVPGNRGELGKRYFRKTNRAGQEAANRIDKIAKELIRVYETITNQIINGIQNRNEDGTVVSSEQVGYMKKNDTFPSGDSNEPQQMTENCFRCDEVGSVNKKRLITNTYIPSFGVPYQDNQFFKSGLCKEATRYIAPIYGLLLNSQCQLQIYTAVLWDVQSEFIRLGEEYGVNYLGAAIKTTIETMEDPVNFIKQNPEKNNDGGDYAAEQAQQRLKEWSYPVFASNFSTIQNNVREDACTNGRRRLESSDGVLSAIQSISANETANTFATPMTAADANGLNKDTNCENDSTDSVALEAAGQCHIPGYDVVPPTQLFAAPWQKQDVTNPAASAKATWIVIMAVVLSTFV